MLLPARRWALVLTSVLAYGGCTTGQNAGPGTIRVVDATTQPAAWQVALEPDATATVRHDGSPIVRFHYVFWGADWRWAHADARTGAPDAATPLAIAVRDLGLACSGTVARAERGLLFTFPWVAERARTGVIGGGFEFNLTLRNPGLPGAGEPELLPDNGGWRWPVGDGEAIEMRFEPGLAALYFERGRKETIRAYFYSQDIPAGPRRWTMRLILPAGGQVAPSAAERYGAADPDAWPADRLSWERSPVDLSHLSDKPAGVHGFVRAEGDRFVFEDGTEARFWGGNLAAYALFGEKPWIEVQARRIAQLGYNLMRLHHHDSTRWVNPTVIDKARGDSQHLDAAAMDRLDYWIWCLKQEGVYVWLDLHVGRQFFEGDVRSPFGLLQGYDELQRRGQEAKGFCYYNDTVQRLMQAFNEQYLRHVNPYTGLAYVDEPAVMGVSITNENDLTHHFGNLMLPDKNNPYHNGLFQADVAAFCRRTGLPADQTWRTWEPGPAKIYLNDVEHRFNVAMIEHLRGLGLRVPIATTQTWGEMRCSSLPALADGDMIDVHSYGGEESLGVNPRYDANFIAWIAAGQVAGKPLVITEWNTPYPTTDRFVNPLYLASIAALQGWDAPMIYNYSQDPLGRPDRAREWSTYNDPGLTALMPAAALAYRRGDIAPARTTVHLRLDRQQAYYRDLSPASSAAIRTIAEQHRLTIGLPDVPELDWDRATPPDAGAEVLDDPDRDLLPPGATEVVSDTAELRRDWVLGIQTINTPRTQAAGGWLGGKRIELADVVFAIRTPKAVVAVSSLDGLPIRDSRRLLITVVARVIAPENRLPFRSEPVIGELTIRAPAGLTCRALGPDATAEPGPATVYVDGAYQLSLGAEVNSHWYVIE